MVTLSLALYGSLSLSRSLWLSRSLAVYGSLALSCSLWLAHSLALLLSMALALSLSLVHQVCLLGVYLGVFFSLYLVPLAMYSPCIREAGTLGPKPTLLGHRGAPMLAPENTLMSFESAVEAGVDGLETDITISADGVPFVMHDLTLQRTTNVEEVFPNRTHTPAALFTWSDVQQLNAGAWFLSVRTLWDPFGTVSSLSPEQRALAANQTVPSLAEVLGVANRTGRTVLFDLRQPPPGHPYRDNYLNITLDLIHTHINSSQVLWLPSDQRGEIQQVDPELQQTAGQTASIQELQDNHITSLNLHYSTMSLQHISKYRSVNISVNLYVVNQPWLYSLAWCSGASSVTTNNMLLRDIHTPLLLVVRHTHTLLLLVVRHTHTLLLLVVRHTHTPLLLVVRHTHTLLLLVVRHTHTHCYTHTHTAAPCGETHTHTSAPCGETHTHTIFFFPAIIMSRPPLSSLL
uniref:Glycerophosphodiester phosphodiesterase domain containing 4 n=1 Tax=Oncorhynchus kisutch TaxID=8019 RepID=A0A8C7FGM7_ONCKI